MANLNLEFYNSKEDNFDKKFDSRVFELIKKYNGNYEAALAEDSSWPVFYHLSDIRKNVVKWYPFKKKSSVLEVGAGFGAITDELIKKCRFVTSIELSKKKAEAILLRNSTADNLDVIVGNIKNIKLKEKYDYIFLNGVFEYAQLYTDSKNPYIDLINLLKQYLKDDGKILLTIQNRLGLKYLCGAKQDSGKKSYEDINNIDYLNKKTFDKNQMDEIITSCNMYSNYYYLFPDFKFNKIVFTDESINKGVFCNYNPCYFEHMDLLINEKKLFSILYDNKTISLFANSFFIELSLEPVKKEVLFAKFNNDYRKKEYDITTIMKNNKFYKIPNSIEANEHLYRIYNLSKDLENKSINIAKVFNDNNCIYSNFVKGDSLLDIIKQLSVEEKYTEIYKIMCNILCIIKKTSGKVIKCEKNIFDDYKVDLSDPNKYKYYEYSVVDIIPSNIIVQNDEYCLIDQEWILNNVPLEYSMYRAITSLKSCVEISIEFIDKLYDDFNIDVDLFNKLEEKFVEDIRKFTYKYYSKYYSNYRLVDVNLIKENEKVYSENAKHVEEIKELKKIIKNQEKIINNILNSKWWKLKSKLLFWKRSE